MQVQSAFFPVCIVGHKYSCGRTVIGAGVGGSQIVREFEIQVLNQRIPVENPALEHFCDGLTILDVLVPPTLIVLQCRIMLNSAALFSCSSIAQSLVQNKRSLPSPHFFRGRHRNVLPG